jgi:hypothetical protein
VIGTTPLDELREHADYLVSSLESVTVESTGPEGVALLITSDF